MLELKPLCPPSSVHGGGSNFFHFQSAGGKVKLFRTEEIALYSGEKKLNTKK